MPTPSFMDGYELANDSIRRFWLEFPMGRLFTDFDHSKTDLEKGYCTFRAEVYRDYDDLRPSATATATGVQALYAPTMKRFYVEDTETSALARAIKTLSPSAQRPSVEDMVKVEGLTLVPDLPTASLDIQVSTDSRDPWSFGSALDSAIAAIPAPDAPASCRHGAMEPKEGISDKTGKPYSGWVCTAKNRAEQCKAIWL